MKYFLLCFILAGSIAHAGWQTGEIHVRDDNSKGPTAIYVNTQGMDDRWPYPPGVWNTVEVAKIPNGDVPATAKAVLLHGELIITHGNKVEQCSLWINYRAPGDPIIPEAYVSVLSDAPGVGGLRQNESTWVPVKDGKFEFYWKRTTEGSWPDFCSYGINLNVQAFLK